MLCIAFGLRLGGVFRCVVMVVMLVMVEFVLLLGKLGFWLGVCWLLIVCELCGWVYVALFDSVVALGCCVVVGFLVCVVLLVL